MRQSVAKRVMLRSVGWVRGSLLMGLLWAVAGWLPAQSLTYLGTLNSLYGESEAFGVSVDGCVVVGWSYYEAPDRRGERAFRWTLEHGMQDLGTLGGPYGSEAFGVSADGRVVVGWANDAQGSPRAVRWTPERGLEDLNLTYASLLGAGSVLLAVNAVSPDGRYLVGYGWNGAGGRGEAFLLDSWRVGDTNGDGCVDDGDLLNVLMAFGTPGTGAARHEDLNRDGIVDDADLLVVLFNFGSGC